MTRILVIRFSSMGDVLLTAPVMKGALEANPDLQIDFVTKESFAGYFSSIERLKIISADTKNKHKGLRGLFRLYKEINRSSKPEFILDLHEVIRSRILRYFFAMNGIPVYRINKGRLEKKAYLKVRKRKVLKHTTERYLDVFTNAGIKASIVNFPFESASPTRADKSPGTYSIGIAPFARHRSKSWDLLNVIELIKLLDSKLDGNFHFYGSTDDGDKLRELNFGDISTHIHAGLLKPQEEIASISEHDIFISMDSANMHLADLIGIPVVSIWGGTHPDLGFRPLNQIDTNNLLTEDSLPCQPCSVYGNKACSLSESKYKCLNTITPERVSIKILALISPDSKVF